MWPVVFSLTCTSTHWRLQSALWQRNQNNTVYLQDRDSDHIPLTVHRGMLTRYMFLHVAYGVLITSQRYTLKLPSENQWLAWLMCLMLRKTRVVIHQVFSQRACFCSIIRLRCKDTSRNQTSPEMNCEIQADRQYKDKESGRLMEGNKEMQAEMKLTSLEEVFLCTWERWH